MATVRELLEALSSAGEVYARAPLTREDDVWFTHPLRLHKGDFIALLRKLDPAAEARPFEVAESWYVDPYGVEKADRTFWIGGK